MVKPTKVLRKGRMQLVGEKDIERGDLQFQSVETEKEISVKDVTLPGTRKVAVLAIGPFTIYAVRFNGNNMRVPQWLVLTNGQALKFHRVFRGPVEEVEPGEWVFPGGAVFRPCPKTLGI